MNNNPLLADLRPWCIGRFVIDRSAHSEISDEEYKYWGDKIDIARNVSTGTFQHKVETREKELKAKKRTVSLPLTREMVAAGKNGIKETTTTWLENSGSPTPNSRLLIFKKFEDTDYSFTAEGYVHVGSTMLTMRSSAASDGVQKYIDLTTDEFRHIFYRDDWTVPAERGFCINGALIGGPSRNSEDVTQSFILLPGRRSLLVIQMSAAVEDDPNTSLLKSLSDLKQQLHDQGYSHYVHILRKGKRKVAGMDAEEVLFSIRDGKTQLFRFYLLASGNSATTAKPRIDIQLELGDALTDYDKEQGETQETMNSPVDEAGAIQAWDTLLNSMRLRPGAM
jgi:hypothetical protein